MRRIQLMCAVTAVSAIAGCGASVRSRAPTAADLRRDLAGSPAPLARLHAEADELLPTTPAAFRSLLASLRGYPVIVNQWGSWCEPCRVEFPILQQAAASLGRKVALIGLDVSDSRSAAGAFLREFPVAYPSYEDPSAHVAFSLKAGAYYPTTQFYDRSGKLVFTHLGPFTTVGQITSDASAYAGA
jgi:thiol-disulfide isomerase/thioredoxin